MAEEQPLAGLRVHLTAHRRSQEIDDALARRGAEIVHCPSKVPVSAEDDADLPRRTRDIIALAPDVVVVTTGVGLKGWLLSAARAGLEEQLRDTLSRARLIARGAKAHGAIRGAGFDAEWVAPTETAAEIIDYLGRAGIQGLDVAVQYHGMGTDGFAEALTGLGARAHGVVVYRYALPDDPEPVQNSIAAAASGACDAVLFTSAGGATCWIDAATEDQRRAIADRTQQGTLGLFAVGNVTAEPLEKFGLFVRYPDRFRLGATLNLLSAWGREVPHVGRGVAS